MNQKKITFEGLLPLPPWKGLPLPSELDLTWKRSTSTGISYTIAIFRFILGGTILPDALALTFKSISSAASSPLDRGTALILWKGTVESYVGNQGKLSQFESFYNNVSPPPVFWDYKCFKCGWWIEPSTCKVVEGEISPQGWCSVWIPDGKRKAGTWPVELIKGEW